MWLFSLDCGDIYTVPPSTPSNLLGNGGFELKKAGWETSNSNFSVIPNNPRTGSKHSTVVGDGTLQEIFWSEYFPVLPGEDYYMEAWLRVSGASPRTAGIGIKWYSGDKLTTSVQETTSSHNTGYARDTITVTVPSAKLWARVYLILSTGVTASTSIYFDDVVFRKLVDKVYDGTAERSIGVAADDIPIIDEAATITDGKLPLNLSQIIAVTSSSNELILKIGNIYIWHDGNNLMRSTSLPASLSTAGTKIVSEEA